MAVLLDKSVARLSLYTGHCAVDKYVEELIELLDQLWELEARIKILRTKLIEEYNVDVVAVAKVGENAT